MILVVLGHVGTFHLPQVADLLNQAPRSTRRTWLELSLAHQTDRSLQRDRPMEPDVFSSTTMRSPPVWSKFFGLFLNRVPRHSTTISGSI